MYLGLNIKRLRKARKLSQTELGEELGVSNSQIGAYESEKSEPPVSKLILLADLFEVSLQDLVLTDLSKEEPKYERPDVAYGSLDEETKEDVFHELNEELRKRIKVLEAFVANVAPEEAKRWGIIE